MILLNKVIPCSPVMIAPCKCKGRPSVGFVKAQSDETPTIVDDSDTAAGQIKGSIKSTVATMGAAIDVHPMHTAPKDHCLERQAMPRTPAARPVTKSSGACSTTHSGCKMLMAECAPILDAIPSPAVVSELLTQCNSASVLALACTRDNVDAENCRRDS